MLHEQKFSLFSNTKKDQHGSVDVKVRISKNALYFVTINCVHEIKSKIHGKFSNLLYKLSKHKT